MSKSENMAYVIPISCKMVQRLTRGCELCLMDRNCNPWTCELRHELALACAKLAQDFASKFDIIHPNVPVRNWRLND